MDINTVDFPEELTALPKLTPRQNEILALITKAIDESGLPPTRAEIATQLGFASANAAEEHLRALAKKGYIELTPGTSRGIRMLQRFNQSHHSNKHRQLSRPSGALQQLTLPLIGRVAAGSPIMAIEHIEKQVLIDSTVFSTGADYLLKVKGMSMRDAGILDGDYLAVRITTEVRNGDIVVARLDDEVTVKRWQQKKTANGMVIELQAENPDFTNILVDSRQPNLAIEGQAVGLIRAAVL
ncbi:transcriptional repressor LexA [Polynucleobacter necessarius]|uniref:transcriptional repressor LexA n=1 Tax=Polynucleobacter necessarius TaxID=576610 RepID=UPI000E093C20|nr:transcriptional repressor LexA [Polynucleobacter necessarius]HAT39012.1 repressor LexA [Polynucleobacter sp.]